MSNEKAADQGRLVDNAITTKDFVNKTDATRFGVNNPPGTVKWLGTIIGKTIGGKEKVTVQPDGTPLRSFQFEGAFEAEMYETGEIKSARSVFLPKAIATELELTLKEVQANPEDGESSVVFAIEIGLEASDRTIPYGYKVRAFGQKKHDILADVRSMLPGRGVPRLAVETPAPVEQTSQAEPAEQAEERNMFDGTVGEETTTKRSNKKSAA